MRAGGVGLRAEAIGYVRCGGAAMRASAELRAVGSGPPARRTSATSATRTHARTHAHTLCVPTTRAQAGTNLRMQRGGTICAWRTESVRIFHPSNLTCSKSSILSPRRVRCTRAKQAARQPSCAKLSTAARVLDWDGCYRRLNHKMNRGVSPRCMHHAPCHDACCTRQRGETLGGASIVHGEGLGVARRGPLRHE